MLGLGLLLRLLPGFSSTVALCQLMLGVIYPTFKSFAAIETKTSKEDDEQWLTYWVVYASLNMVEGLAWPVLMWVPLYGVLKCGLLMWLVVPRFLGARVLYTGFVRNMLYVAAEALKEVPALEDVVKPFVDKLGGKGGVRRAAPQSSVAGVAGVAGMAGREGETKDG